MLTLAYARSLTQYLFCMYYSYIIIPKLFCVITYRRKELLDIRATVTHQHYQHYDKEHDFPKEDPLFAPHWSIELMPEADPKHRRRRRGTRSGLPVQLRRCAHHPLLPSILLANVQSLYNKVVELSVRISFQRDIRDCNILCFTEPWLSRDILSESVLPVGFLVHRADRNKYLSGKRKGGGVS